LHDEAGAAAREARLAERTRALQAGERQLERDRAELVAQHRALAVLAERLSEEAPPATRQQPGASRVEGEGVGARRADSALRGLGSRGSGDLARWAASGGSAPAPAAAVQGSGARVHAMAQEVARLSEAIRTLAAPPA